MSLAFKKIQIDDIPFINQVRNGYAQKYLHDSRIFNIEETYDWFNKIKPDYWTIFDNDNRIGYFRLSNHSIENKNIYIGADIAPQYTGRGYATLAYTLFIPFLFDSYNLNKISLEVISTNIVARNLYNKLGFIYEGTKRDDIIKDGEWVDSIMMSILKKEYSKL